MSVTPVPHMQSVLADAMRMKNAIFSNDKKKLRGCDLDRPLFRRGVHYNGPVDVG